MRYRVVLQRLAVADLDDAYRYVAQQAPEAAAKWLQRFHQALKTLEGGPNRCPLARESKQASIDIHEFLFGKRRNVFRVLYSIDQQTVRVLCIRREQRQFLNQREINEAEDSVDDR